MPLENLVETLEGIAGYGPMVAASFQGDPLDHVRATAFTDHDAMRIYRLSASGRMPP